MPPFRKRGDSEEGSTESTPRGGVTPGGAKRRRRDGTDIGGHRRCVFKLTAEENVGFMDRIRVSLHRGRETPPPAVAQRGICWALLGSCWAFCKMIGFLLGFVGVRWVFRKIIGSFVRLWWHALGIL